MSEKEIKVDDFFEVLDIDSRKEMSEDTVKRLQDLSELEKKTLTSLNMLKISMAIVFLLGLVLITSAIVIIFINIRSEETTKIAEAIALLVGGTFSEAFGTFLYLPMRKLIHSESDLVQQYIILRSWAIFTNLQLLAMNANKPETIYNSAKEISEQTLKHVNWIEELVASRKQKEKKEKQGK